MLSWLSATPNDEWRNTAHGMEGANKLSSYMGVVRQTPGESFFHNYCDCLIGEKNNVVRRCQTMRVGMQSSVDPRKDKFV